MRGGYRENVNEILVDAAELIHELALPPPKGDALRPLVWRRRTPPRGGCVGCLVDEPSCQDLALVLLRSVQAAKIGRASEAADEKIRAIGPPLIHLLEHAGHCSWPGDFEGPLFKERGKKHQKKVEKGQKRKKKMR